MKPWTVTFSPQFSRDIEDIVSYIAVTFNDIDNAEKVLALIHDAISGLHNMPRHPAIPECSELSERYVTAGKYVIIFYPTKTRALSKFYAYYTLTVTSQTS